MALDRIMMQDGTTKQWGALDKLDAVKDTWIDWGTGAGQVSGGDMPLADTGGFFTTDDVESALQEIAGYNFNTRKFIANTVAVTNGNTTAAITAANQVPTEVIADQSTTNVGALLGASHIALGALPTPAGGAVVTVEDRRILMIIVDANGDPVLMGGGQQVFALYDSKRSAGQTIYAAGGDAQWTFVYNDAGTYKAAAFPAATGNYYSWPVIRYDFLDLPEDAMLYGGGGAEDLDNTPYSAGTGIAISGAYAISFDQAANLASLTGTWTAGAAFSLVAAAAGYSDGLVVPVNAGAPAGAATEGAIMWDSTGDNLYVSQGGTWKQISSAAVLPASGAAGQTLVGDGSSGWVTNPQLVSNATTGLLTAKIPDNNASAMLVENLTDGNDYLKIDTTTGSEIITFGNTTDNPDYAFAGSGTFTQSGAGQVEFNGNVDAKNGLDVTTAALTAAAGITQTGGAFTMTGTNLDLDPTGTFDLSMDAAQTVSFHLADNLPNAFLVENAGGDDFIAIDTTNAAEVIALGNAVSNPAISLLGTGQKTINGNLDSTGGVDVSGGPFTFTGTTFNLDPTDNFTVDMAATKTVYFTVADNLANTFRIQEGANMIMQVDSVNASEKIDFGYNVNATAGLDVTGSNLTVGGASFVVNVGTGAVTAGSWTATAVATQYGGTGQNWSGVAQGSLPYFNGVGTMTTLGIGTAYQTLRTNAGATAPEWTSEGQMVTGSLVAVAAGVTAKRLVAAHNDAGTGKLEDASAAAASTAFQVVGVALAAAAGGAAVRLQTTGVVTLTLPAVHAAITAGDTAYLAQAAGGYVVMYTNIAYTSTAYIVPVGVFLQTIAANTGGDVLVALGGVGMGAVYVP